MKKKVDISPITILSSIERDVKELLPEVSKAYKAKVISIQESIKLLTKKLMSSSSIQKNPSSICPSSDENKSKVDQELIQLNQENNKLKAEISHLNHLLQEKTKINNKNESSTTDLRYFLKEEQNKNSILLLQVKTVEDNFKILNKEYQALSERHELVLKEMESLCQSSAEMKKSTNANRYKYEDLAEINTELKNKLLSYENNISTHSEDVKNLMKKNSQQRARIEDLEKTNKTLVAEVNYKEERIKALRLMNVKLETNTKRLINKWGSLSKIEEKNNLISQEANEAFDTLREMNEHLNFESASNRNLQIQLNKADTSNQMLQKEINNLKEVNRSLSEVNKELLYKNKGLETKLKEALEKKEKHLLTSSNRGNNFLTLSGDWNNNDDIGTPLEKFEPAKLLLK